MPYPFLNPLSHNLNTLQYEKSLEMRKRMLFKSSWWRHARLFEGLYLTIQTLPSFPLTVQLTFTYRESRRSQPALGRRRHKRLYSKSHVHNYSIFKRCPALHTLTGVGSWCYSFNNYFCMWHSTHDALIFPVPKGAWIHRTENKHGSRSFYNIHAIRCKEPLWKWCW